MHAAIQEHEWAAVSLSAFGCAWSHRIGVACQRTARALGTVYVFHCCRVRRCQPRTQEGWTTKPQCLRHSVIIEEHLCSLVACPSRVVGFQEYRHPHGCLIACVLDHTQKRKIKTKSTPNLLSSLILFLSKSTTRASYSTQTDLVYLLPGAPLELSS